MKHNLFKQIKTTQIIIAVLSIACIGLLVYSFSDKNPNKGKADYGEIESIKGSNMDFGQLSKYFSDLAEEQGGEYAYKSLAKAAALSYIPQNIDLHLLGHVVGDVLYKQEGIDGIKVCTNDLRNACSHSIVVGALLEFGESSLGEIVDTCKLAPGGSGAYTMCIHGLGHGVLAYTEYDMKKAIDFCGKIMPPSFDRVYVECAGGIAMEMMSGINDPEAWRKQSVNYFKKDDPLAPCNMDFMPKEAQPICYNFLTPHLIEASGGNFGSPTPEDYKAAFKLCDTIPKNQDANRNSCFGGLGKEFPVLVNNRNVQNVTSLSDDKLKTIYEWCSLGIGEESTRACLNSSLQSLYWGGENEPQISIRFCRTMGTSEHQNFCFENLFGSVSYYISDSSYKKQFCSDVPENFQDRCKRALSI
ncbi:MAG TPA: hypothetical protein VD998_01770 [Verrucomicrobiae bacterium]|nr:hypothetical protein [Verrucomicrobiae bacterium]